MQKCSACQGKIPLKPRNEMEVTCRRGDLVTLVGSVHIDRYDKERQKRNYTEVKVEEIHFSGGRKNTASTSNDLTPSGADPLF